MIDQPPRERFHVIQRRTKTTSTKTSITTIEGGLAQHNFFFEQKQAVIKTPVFHEILVGW